MRAGGGLDEMWAGIILYYSRLYIPTYSTHPRAYPRSSAAPRLGGVRVGVIAAKPTTLWGHKKVSLEIVGNCAMLILPGEWFPLAWFASWRCEMFRTLYLVPPDERRPGTRVESCRGQYVYEVKRRERKPTKHGEVRHYWVDPETGKWYNETLSAK